MSSKRSPQNSTVFLDDLPVSNWQSFLHHLSVAQFAGVSLLRLLTIAWFFVTALGLLGTYPGGTVIGALLLVALIAFYVHFSTHKRSNFVQFTAGKKAQPVAASLPIEHKIAVYVTGECSVEGKRRKFTCLPGFYRTFATREHALLCQVKDRRIFGIASWRKDEVGLWYVFFYPAAIRSIEMGSLQYGNRSMPAIAVEYTATLSYNKMGEPDKTASQLIYVSALEDEGVQAILADLFVDAAVVNQQKATTN